MSLLLGFELRQAKKQDVTSIWQLISGVMAEFGMAACRASTERELSDIEANFLGSGGEFLVLLDGTDLIGTAALKRHSVGVGEVCRMYLDRRYRGRGLGRGLLEAILTRARARGLLELRLQTSAVLTQAISLYESAGFLLTTEPASGADCSLVMRKRLT